MNFIEELKWRNMLQDTTPGVEQLLENGNVVGYIGFDPTAKSLTIGNYVQIMLLRLFQLSGHTPIVLMGGATGRIGDPSGKDKERQLKSYDELDANLNHQLTQVKQFLDFEGPHAAKIVNNHDFYKEMNILDFLRNVGKTLTVNYMMSKDSVKNRLETGLSFTEFSYQLLQAYDFQCLYEQYDCKLQMGGSDQWGNITSGTEFIRRNTEGGKAYAITTPLLTKADGTKFGKSEAGNIWMDASLTSPYAFYQFWINADDADIPTFKRYFTLKSQAEVESEEQQYAEDPRMLKKLLAEELLERVHGAQSLEAVRLVSDILFNKKASPEQLRSMDLPTLDIVAGEIPCKKVDRAAVANTMDILTLLSEATDIAASKSEARRAIKNNAIAVNKVKLASEEATVGPEDVLEGKYIMIENGKKKKYLLELT